MQPFDRSIFMRGELLQPKWMVKNMLKEPWLHEYEQHKIRQREKQKQERANKKKMISEIRGRSGSTGGKKSRGNAHVPTPKQTTARNPRVRVRPVRPDPAKRAKQSSAAKMADAQSSALHDASPPAKRVKQSGKCSECMRPQHAKKRCAQDQTHRNRKCSRWNVCTTESQRNLPAWDSPGSVR